MFKKKSTRVQSIIFQISALTEDFPVFLEIQEYKSFIKLTHGGVFNFSIFTYVPHTFAFAAYSQSFESKLCTL